MSTSDRHVSLRKALIAKAKSYKVKDVAVPLSSGVDSHCALFACLEAGLNVTVYSFHVKGIDSRDFKIAKNTAKVFGLPFVEVVLPDSVPRLIADVKALAAFGCTSKTDFECFWPMWYMIPKIKQKVFFTGHGADSLYCMSRKASQHFAGREDEFRKQAFASKKSFQRGHIESLCETHGIQYCPIFCNDKILAIFEGSSKKELHQPVQKAVSRNAFPEYFERIKVYAHQPFQLGDSDIRDRFERILLESALNSQGYKSVVGVYNELVRKYGPK